MTVAGTNGSPAAVEAINEDVPMYAQHEIHFFTERPKEPCARDHLSSGFDIYFAQPLRKGLTTRSSAKSFLPYPVVRWDEPGSVLGGENNGWMSAIIDEVTPSVIRGRVAAWTNDPSKSIIVGAFTATNCHVSKRN